jgi:hypothetical protein
MFLEALHRVIETTVILSNQTMGMMYMKWVIGSCAFLLALYTGFQSILISQVGFSQQIPQLMGDGGGGILLSILTLLTAIVCIAKPYIAMFMFLFCTILSAFVSLIFNDSIILLWACCTTTFAIFCFFTSRNKNRHLINRKRKVKYSKT